LFTKKRIVLGVDQYSGIKANPIKTPINAVVPHPAATFQYSKVSGHTASSWDFRQGDFSKKAPKGKRSQRSRKIGEKIQYNIFYSYIHYDE
jgi:hypothetical protein